MHRNFASLCLICVISLFAPLTASATPITVPTDLNVGDKYRLAFVTSTARNATSSDIADYNAFVAAVAAAVPELATLGTTWSAIGSTPTIDARDNTATNPTTSLGIPIYRLDDTRIADDNLDLWDGSLQAPLQVSEAGVVTIQPYVWTGSSADGVARPTFELGAQIPVMGHSSASGSTWVEFSADFHLFNHRLYALSAELTVVPEPSTLTMGWIAATAVVGWQLHRRRNRIRQ